MMRGTRLSLGAGFLAAVLTALAWASPAAAADKKLRMVIMPKLVGIQYYDVVKQGVDDAVKELPDVQVQWIGPTSAEADKQIELLRSVIPTRPDLIAVAADDPAALVPIFKEAKAAGIRVMSWDGDVNFREAFVNLVDFDEFGAGLLKSMVSQIGEKGDIAIITTTFTAPNQVRWIEAIKKTAAASYPGIKILDVRPAGEDTNKAFQIAQDLIKTTPSLKGIIALGVPNVPGAAEAVKEAGMAGKIAVVGNSTPGPIAPYLKSGVVKESLLWNAPDHGYLTVYTAYALLKDKLVAGKPYSAGRLGEYTPKKDDRSLTVALPVLTFTKDNVDQYKF